MTESDQDRERRLLEEFKGKNVAYYQVMLSAWIQTRMEHDKTLITLSSAAIALLVTVASTVGTDNKLVLWLYPISLLSFLTCIITSLKVYRLNSTLIETELAKAGDKPNLKPYDRIAKFSFMMGGAVFCLIGIATITL
jgi:hypothetical protein